MKKEPNENEEGGVDVASKQLSLLKRLIHQHRLEWSKIFKDCQPLITLTDKPPSFMRVLETQCKGRFLVVSNAVIAKSENLEPIVSKSEIEEVVMPSGLEISGCPLECPFTAEEMDLLNSRLTALNINFFPLDIYNPLPSRFARNIMLWYTMEVTKFCKANNTNHQNLASVIIVCSKENNNSMMHSSILGTGSLSCIGDTTIEATCLGNLNATEMKSMREKISNQALKSGAKIAKAVLRAEYLQQTHLAEGVNSSENAKADCFHIKMMWNDPKNYNSDIPTTQLAGTVANIEITLQDNFQRWQTGKIWEEIHLLQFIGKLLDSDKLDPDTLLPSVYGDPPNKTIPEILSASYDTSMDVELQSLESLFKFVSDGLRPCTDLTDAVWNSMKYYTTFDEIGKGLEHVMKQSVIHNFAVQPSNTSTLGKMCRALFESKDATLISIPEQRQILLYMLEIGFLKVQRDFMFVAKQSEMMILNIITKNLDHLEWSKKLEKLNQVHQAFELVLRAGEWLHLKKDGLVDLFVKCLDTPFLETVLITMQSYHLTHIISSYEPVVRSWDLELSKGVTTIFHHFVASQYPIFSWTMAKPQDEESHNENERGEIKFHCALLMEQKRPVRC